MKFVEKIKQGLEYLKDQNIDIRTRMLFFLEYAVLFAGIVGTIIMSLFATSIVVLIPNFILIAVCLIGVYFSRVRGQSDLSAKIIVGGCAYIALPFMFFTSGGNQSGMPIWFLFGVIFICMMLKDRFRVLMAGVGVVVGLTCMLVGYHHPELVIPLKNEQAGFMDMVQSFAVVSIIVCLCLYIYISAYDEQRRLLLERSEELKRIMYTDALTEIPNRHAYYDDSKQYTENGYKENLVLVAMDVNGLKRVNDTKGHAAGDAFIKTSAAVMVDAYSKYGKIYRTGGDEFVAILSCENQEAERLEDILETTIKYTNEKTDSSVSIAIGIAVWNKNQEKDFFELEKMADATMYQNKSKFYRESGMDRRKR